MARNININDNLNNALLFLNFSELTYEDFQSLGESDKYYKIIECGENNAIFIGRSKTSGEERAYGIIRIQYKNELNDILFMIYEDVTQPVINLTSYKLPSDFGIVTNITALTGYDCIKISPHDKVYTICDNMCLEESLTKEQIEEVVDEQVKGYGVPVNSVFDFDGDIIPGGYEEVDDPSVYSTEEKRVGTWINGQPLYRKTIIYNEVGNNDWFIKPTGLSNIIVRKIEGTVMSSDNTVTYAIPFISNEAKYLYLNTTKSGSNLLVRTNDDWTDCTLIVTIYYTK